MVAIQGRPVALWIPVMRACVCMMQMSRLDWGRGVAWKERWGDGLGCIWRWVALGRAMPLKRHFLMV